MDRQTRRQAFIGSKFGVRSGTRAEINRQSRGDDALSPVTQGLVQRARRTPEQLSAQEVQTLQRSMGNRAVSHLVAEQRGAHQSVPQSVQRSIIRGPAARQPLVQRAGDDIRTYDKSGAAHSEEATWQKSAFGLNSWQRNPEKPSLPTKQKAFKPKQQERDRAMLLNRIAQIQPLAGNSAFKTAVNAYVDTVGKEAAGEGSGQAQIAICDQIVDALESIRGFEVPYRWFVQNQQKPNFKAELLPTKAKSASGQGRFWSKLSTRRSEQGAGSSESTTEGGLYLESSVAGVLFNGLMFGAPWGASPTMGYLWDHLSTAYANHLHGTVEADVLDGRDPNSVLSNHEWHRLRQSILSGKVQSFVVNIHEFRNNRFKIVKQVKITKQNLTAWFGEVPEVPKTNEWKAHQSAIDAHEKTLALLDSAFRDIDKDVASGKRVLTLQEVQER